MGRGSATGRIPGRPAGACWYSDGRKRSIRNRYSQEYPGYSVVFLPSGDRYQLLQPEVHTVCFMRRCSIRLNRSWTDLRTSIHFSPRRCMYRIALIA